MHCFYNALWFFSYLWRTKAEKLFVGIIYWIRKSSEANLYHTIWVELGIIGSELWLKLLDAYAI